MANEIKVSTLKSKATRNFNKSAANQKDPGPGDIMMPMRNYKGVLSNYFDDLGAPIKCVVTHAYKNYIFGTIINTIPNTKNPKEVCLTDAIEADSWEYDIEICTRAVIEEQSALILALNDIKRRHEKVKEWKKHLTNIAIPFPSDYVIYENYIKKGFIGMHVSHVSPNAKKVNAWPLNSFIVRLTGAHSHQAIQDKYQANFKQQINDRILYLPDQIISFEDWLIQNP